MKAAPSAAAALLAALMAVAGCTHYTLKPEPPSSLPRAAQPPLPLRVGLVLDEQGSALSLGGSSRGAYGKRGARAESYAFGPQFAQALRQSRLFQDVRYPLGLSRAAFAGVDLVISAQFGTSFTQDPSQAAKIVFVVFTGFITGAVMSETSHHLAQGVLSVEDAAGRRLRTYDETVDVTAKSMVSMFAEQRTMKAGPPAAAENLIARLVQRLIDDRALFAERRAAPPAAVEPAPSAPEPAASETPAEAPPAAAAPPAEVPAPAKPEPKPIPPETYDDQL